jgi:hypothetical protein
MAKELKRPARKSPPPTTTAATTGSGSSTAVATMPPPRLAPKPTSNRPTQEQIRLRAYQIFMARNGKAGDPAADWIKAERELIEELSR